MTRTRLISAVLAAAASAALLAGCTLFPGAASSQTAQPPGAIGSTEPTAPPSSPPASATPTPIPTSTNPADAYILSSEGYGPLRVREPIRVKQPFVAWTDHLCGPGENVGGWQPTDYHFAGDDSAPVEAWGGAKRTSPLMYVIVHSTQVHTKHGLHLGSSLADAKALGAVKVEKDNGFGDYEDGGWVIRGSVGELIMWFSDQKMVVLAVEPRDNDWHWFPYEGQCG